MSIDVLKQVSIACKRLVTMEPFYGLFAIGLNRVTSETRVPTAGVTKGGINVELIVNPKFWGELSTDHHIGLIKHELLHIAFNHILTWKDYPDRELFNIAADLEINQYIDDKYLPPFALKLDKYELQDHPRMGTKFYYEKLQKDLQDGKNPNLQALYNAMKAGNQVICSHDLWKAFENLSEAEKQLIKTQIDSQIKELVQSGKLAGKIPSEMKNWIDAIFLEVPPVVDWRAILRRMIGGSTEVFTRKTRRKKSKRMPQMPGLKIMVKPLGAIYWDQSGSVGPKDHERFFNEIFYMHKMGLNFDIIPFNSVVLKPYRYKGEPKYCVTGGGTSFTPVIEDFNLRSKEYAYCIILTDGYAEMPPKCKKPLIWVITPDANNGKKLEDMKDWPGVFIKMNDD